MSEPITTDIKPTTLTLQLTPAEWVQLGCAGFLCLGFFIPTLHWFFGSKVSLLDLAQHGEGMKYKILWLLPILGAGTALQIMLRKDRKVLGQLAGATPFVPLIWNLVEHGQEITKLLMPTAYLYLVCGVILFVLSPRIKPATATVTVHSTEPPP